MSPRKPADVGPAAPRSDAPEHPLDPADAAFLDPASVRRPAPPAPAEARDADPPPPGFGDFEGERPDAHDAHEDEPVDRAHADRRRAR